MKGPQSTHQATPPASPRLVKEGGPRVCMASPHLQQGRGTVPGGERMQNRGAPEAPLSTAAHKHKKQELLHPCDTEYPVFVHQTAIQETNGIIQCGACQK
ncbi:Hypothetical predicted protein [Marmota monax]|uniref:Uncharacterized protein n=1 Tax=Marmota monax TaxID=9995 RepID=A0A5E4BGH4_MARMO|nr:hypothetical protein GHT09_002885 [Marmota monax]VTJ68071.1 Hypothetical predicted protein [Marmota monax]